MKLTLTAKIRKVAISGCIIACFVGCFACGNSGMQYNADGSRVSATVTIDSTPIAAGGIALNGQGEAIKDGFDAVNNAGGINKLGKK